MKNIILFLLFSSFAKFAEAQVSLQSFYLQGTSIINNKLSVANAALPTNFKFAFTLSRSMLASGGYVSGGCTVTLLYTENTNPSASEYESHPSTVELGVKSVTSSNYGNGQFAQFFNLTAIDATLPANKTAGRILLRYKYYDNVLGKDVTRYSGERYEIYVQPSVPTFDPAHIAKIQSMGFSTSGIANFNSNYYLVDGDVLINKNGLNSGSAYSNIIDNANTHNINISIDQSIWTNGPVYQGFWNALRIWNAANSNIKLHMISTQHGYYGVNPRVDIELKGDAGVLSASTGIVAAYPSGDGKPGNMILINSDFSYDYGQATWYFIHAIGHSLGMKHITNDNSSIMRKYIPPIGIYPTSLPNVDETLLSTMYPLNNASNVQSFIHGINGNFSLSYSSTESGISYHWKVTGINGTSYFYDEIGNDLLWDLYLSNGSYKIDCTISNGKYSSPVTTTKNILIQ